MQPMTTRCLVLILMAAAEAGEPPPVRCPAAPPVVMRLAVRERLRVDADGKEGPLLGYIVRICEEQPPLPTTTPAQPT
ncbi:MAG: hypothetical protein IH621_18090 [Krumholzibacteria bacterium]|nr:hypothetical protein [Candidatus Krumholzibacteria bacterium]